MWAEAVNELLLDFAHTADDRELVRINPKRFALEHAQRAGAAGLYLADLFAERLAAGEVATCAPFAQNTKPACAAGFGG